MPVFKKKKLSEQIDIESYKLEQSKLTAISKKLTYVEKDYKTLQAELQSIEIDRNSLESSEINVKEVAEIGIDALLTRLNNLSKKQKQIDPDELSARELTVNYWWKVHSKQKLNAIAHELNPLLITVQKNIDKLTDEFQTKSNSEELCSILMPLLEQVEPVIEKYTELSRLTTESTVNLKVPSVSTFDEILKKAEDEGKTATAFWYQNQIEADMRNIEKGFDGYLIKK